MYYLFMIEPVFFKQVERDIMNQYITIRIMKKHLALLFIILVLIGSTIGFYFWCAYHPNIYIQIGDNRAGENLKVQAPHIAVAPVGIADSAASIDLKLKGIIDQHEFVCRDLKDTYASSDIDLEMEIKDKEMIMTYKGEATTLAGENVQYEKEFVLEYTVDAKLTKVE